MSDIDTAAADSLKVLDPKRPIREADIGLQRTPRPACVSWVRPASTLSPMAWAKHPLDNRARKLVRSAV